MKQQNDPAKMKHYKIYKDDKPTYIRHKEAIEAIPERCWWLKEYLKGIYRFKSQR